MTAAIIILGWLACAAGAYLLFRHWGRQDVDGWTRGDRSLALVAILAMAPLALFMAILFLWLEASESKEPAKW